METIIKSQIKVCDIGFSGVHKSQLYYLSHLALVLARNVKLLTFGRTFKLPLEGLIPLRIWSSRHNLKKVKEKTKTTVKVVKEE